MKKNVLNYPIWYDRIRLFYETTPNTEWSIWRDALKQFYEVYMKFNEMIDKLDSNVKAFRPTWGKGELMWKQGDVLVHNTPYWTGDYINQFLKGYVYVSEIEDINANDWVLTTTEHVC